MDRIVGQEQEWKARTYSGPECPPVLTWGWGAGVTGVSSPIAAGGQVSIITAYPWVSSHYPFLERSQAG